MGTIERHRRVIERIDGVHPAEYAARWGDGRTIEGMLFYNCGDAIGICVISNPNWKKKQWKQFAEAVTRTISKVRKQLVSPKMPQHLNREDVRNLLRLYRWAKDNEKYGVVRYVGCDGTSGTELFIASEQAVLGFTGSGDKDMHARVCVGSGDFWITWLASADCIRASLREYGGWSDSDLKDEEANKRRILFLVCGDLCEMGATARAEYAYVGDQEYCAQ